eukprot:3546750-Pyramimonas_sp.AAC.1
MGECIDASTHRIHPSMKHSIGRSEMLQGLQKEKGLLEAMLPQVPPPVPLQDPSTHPPGAAEGEQAAQSDAPAGTPSSPSKTPPPTLQGLQKGNKLLKATFRQVPLPAPPRPLHTPSTPPPYASCGTWISPRN